MILINGFCASFQTHWGGEEAVQLNDTTTRTVSTRFYTYQFCKTGAASTPPANNCRYYSRSCCTAASLLKHYSNLWKDSLCSIAAKPAADWKLPWNIFSGGWFLAGMWRSRGAPWQCGTTKPPLPLPHLNPAPSPSCCPRYISAGHFRDPVQC